MADPVTADPVTAVNTNDSAANIRVVVEFTPYTAVVAEGGRVGIMSCKLCGAAIILDPRDGTFHPDEVHRQWHQTEMLRRLR